MSTKRKHNSRRHKHHPDSRDRSSPDTKRRRLSNDESDRVKSSGTNLGIRSREDMDVAKSGSNVDEDGWTKVEYASSRNRHRRGDDDINQSDRPQLRFYENYQGTVRSSDLRDLVLYLLADGVAPNWIGIAGSRYVKKVVTIMVPGLDERLLRRAEGLIKERLAVANGQQGDTDSHESISQEASVSGGGKAVDVKMVNPEKNERSDSEGPARLSWLFNNVLQVKAPGDVRMSRVHSPLQAMLIAPESQSKKTLSGQGSFQAVPTPIIDFVHTADELRDAEFPIHPATFTTKADAELEAVRRQKTGQSIEAGWVDTHVLEPRIQLDPKDSKSLTRGTSIFSVDCEMVQTSDSINSLARVSVISYSGKVVIDKYVKPDLPITNYFTQFSGITPKILENVTTTLQDIQKELLEILTPSSILLGHSLDSDLNALKLTHPFLVDTSLIYPHPRGLPLRSSLKFLANKYLRREIQIGGADGHNSVEDAQAVLDLIKLKCEKGPKWGTMEANGDVIFKRLKQSGRTSGMIEYGTPERGFGKEATHTIGCQDDDEVVKGVMRALKGDDYFQFDIPAGGVDYVWGRLRALEYARGWVSGQATSQAPNTKEASEENIGEAGEKDVANATNNTKKSQEEDNAANIDEIACKTVTRIQQIYDALPEKTLLIVASGTSDIRPVMQLQAQQQQYRKEFKVKKWDDLTVKWTDTEEQALKKACDDARAGWGVCAVK